MISDDEIPFDRSVQAPIFIIGAARSGTTWVYDILTAHGEVAGVFESWLFTDDGGVGKLFGEAHRAGQRSGLANLLDDQQLLEHVREFVVPVLSHAIGPKHRFLIEKSPSHAFSIPLIKKIFPSARIIHVLRDGRDVSVSVRAAIRSWEPSWKAVYGTSVRRSARAWRDLVSTVTRDRKILGDRFLEIRYETLRTNPFDSYRELFGFCGIPYDHSMLQEIHRKTDFKTNYPTDESGFRRGARLGDWAVSFSLWDAFRFHREAGPLLVKLRYAEPGWWLPGHRRNR